MALCIECKYHVMGTAESHKCKENYHQDNSVYTGQCHNEAGHGCKNWAEKCGHFTPEEKEDAPMSQTQETIAECEAMLAEMEGRSTGEEQTKPETGKGLKAGTYLQANGDDKFVYCFSKNRFYNGHHYLHNMIIGSSYNADGKIKKENGEWVLKSDELKIISPAKAMELFKAYHGLK